MWDLLLMFQLWLVTKIQSIRKLMTPVCMSRCMSQLRNRFRGHGCWSRKRKSVCVVRKQTSMIHLSIVNWKCWCETIQSTCTLLNCRRLYITHGCVLHNTQCILANTKLLRCELRMNIIAQVKRPPCIILNNWLWSTIFTKGYCIKQTRIRRSWLIYLPLQSRSLNKFSRKNETNTWKILLLVASMLRY